MQPGRIPALIALVAAMAVAAGSARAAGPALTASSYRTKANAICTKLDRYSPPTTGTTADRFAAALKHAQAAQASLKELRPPSALAPLHQQVIAVIAREFTLFDSLLRKLRAGTLTEAQFEAALDRTTLDKQEDALWRKLGVKVCAQP